ncbi:hypothetical protein PTI98_007276 [Pleurotus ostreatus]|nr:hypothetical protein PTI98_007276 [Pleurotus ostreatus]
MKLLGLGTLLPLNDVWFIGGCSSTECLGLHLGTPQTANLGDGAGDVDELGVWRADFHSPLLGTCLESLIGGNHFRAWMQNSNATSGSGGAVFLA